MSGEIQLPKNPDDALETLGSPLKTDIRKKIEQKMTKSNFFSLKSPVPDTGPITGKKEERELRPGKAEFSPQANKKSFSLIEF
jgi:hypothetical protein